MPSSFLVSLTQLCSLDLSSNIPFSGKPSCVCTPPPMPLFFALYRTAFFSFKALISVCNCTFTSAVICLPPFPPPLASQLREWERSLFVHHLVLEPNTGPGSWEAFSTWMKGLPKLWFPFEMLNSVKGRKVLTRHQNKILSNISSASMQWFILKCRTLWAVIFLHII